MGPFGNGRAVSFFGRVNSLATVVRKYRKLKKDIGTCQAIWKGTELAVETQKSTPLSQ